MLVQCRIRATWQIGLTMLQCMIGSPSLLRTKAGAILLDYANVGGYQQLADITRIGIVA
jgi:hypothetical protein